MMENKFNQILDKLCYDVNVCTMYVHNVYVCACLCVCSHMWVQECVWKGYSFSGNLYR